MNAKLLLGIPELPARAFMRVGGGMIRPHGGGKGDAPDTPDYEAAARATAQGNLEMAKYATQANRPTEITPWGNRTWTNDRTFDQSGYDAALESYNRQMDARNQAMQQQQNNPYGWGGNGESTTGWQQQQYWPGFNQPSAPNAADFYSGGDNWTSNIELSPEMQALFDQQNQLQQGLFGAQDLALGRTNEMMGQGFDMSGIPQAGSIYDPNLDTNNAQELLMRRMNPELDRQQAALQAQLANQGITQGSSAYNTAMGQFGQQRNDASAQAALQGIGLGMQQQGLQFGQSQQSRQQALQEQAFLRSLPLNELNALRTGNQVQQPQFGNFAQQATTAGPDMLGAANAGYQADLGAWNAQQAGSSNMLGGLLGIGGAILGAPAGSIAASMLSDRRLKSDIHRVGTADNGLPIYSYRYTWGGPMMLGFMADEVERVAPEAVGEVDGYKTVDYSKVH